VTPLYCAIRYPRLQQAWKDFKEKKSKLKSKKKPKDEEFREQWGKAGHSPEDIVEDEQVQSLGDFVKAKEKDVRFQERWKMAEAESQMMHSGGFPNEDDLPLGQWQKYTKIGNLSKTYRRKNTLVQAEDYIQM
jgi:hypothetical protein